MGFTEEELAYLQAQEAELMKAKTSSQVNQSNMAQQAMDLQEMTKSMVKEQLDLSEELDTIEHLLRGQVLKETDKGRDWVDTNDPDMTILTEHGIYLIMNTIMFYINKNTLLSNYDEETINKKMYDFANDLADTIFMEYEKVFKYPTFDECKKILTERLDRKTELRSFALELIGKKVDQAQIKEGFIKEIEDRIDVEIAKIREQIIKNKLKRFLILIREVQDSVHSTYLRAYGGQERKTLRQHIHINENVNQAQMSQKPRKINPLNWGA